MKSLNEDPAPHSALSVEFNKEIYRLLVHGACLIYNCSFKFIKDLMSFAKVRVVESLDCVQ